MSDVYSMNEQFWKTLIIGYHMDKGMSEADAAEIAHDALFDYSMVPNWLRAYRENYVIGAPFATFAFKALPKTLEAVFTRPQAFLPYAALIAGMWWLAKEALDMDDDEGEGLVAMLAPWMSKWASVPLPAFDQHNRVQMYDLTWLFPFGNLLKAVEAFVAGEPGKSIEETTALASGPTFQIAASLSRNEDSLGREIWSPDELWQDRMTDMLSYVGGQLTPTVIPQVMDLFDAFRGIPNRFGEPQRTPGQALARIGGVTVAPMDVDQQFEMGSYAWENRIRAAEQQYSKIESDEELAARSPARHEAQLQRQLDLIEKLTEEYDKWAEKAAGALTLARPPPRPAAAAPTRGPVRPSRAALAPAGP